MPLNSVELVFLGGMGIMERGGGHVISFNTATSEFKTLHKGDSCVVGDELVSVKFCENTIVVQNGS